MESLFEQHKDQLEAYFDKVASPIKDLGDNTATWNSQMLAELYRKHSYLGNYTVDMVEKANEPERGYVFGHFTVTTPRALPPQPVGAEGMGAEVTNPSLQQEEELGSTIVKIPIIVRQRRLFPFDVMITPDGQFLPLNEERLQTAMQEMQTQEMGPGQTGYPGYGFTGEQPGVTAVPESYMPHRAGTRVGIGGYKTSSADVGLLDMALTTVTPMLKDAFIYEFKTDGDLRYAFEHNPAFRQAVQKVAAAEPIPTDDIKRQVLQDMPSDVVQFTLDGDKLMMKSACAAAYKPFIEVFAKTDMEVLPPEGRLEIIKHGSLTISPNPKQTALPLRGVEYVTPDVPDSYGVLTKEAKGFEGVVFTNVIGLDNHKLDLQLFVSNDFGAHSLQEKVAAVAIPPGPEMVGMMAAACQDIEPQGYGFFLKTAETAEDTLATIPIHVGNRIRHPSYTSYMFGTDLETGEFVPMEGIQKVAELGSHIYGIPDDWVWVPLGKTVDLLEQPDQFEKAASAETYYCSVKVACDDGVYTLSGPPVDAVKRNGWLDQIKEADAKFILCAVGCDTPTAGAVLARAREDGMAKVSVARRLKFYDDVLKEVTEKVARPFVENMGLRPMLLLKEAAMLADPDSVDAVLSLGFITVDNLMGFVNQADMMEQTLSRLAEMLVAVRLGDLSDVPEPALERAVQTLERTLQGLKTLGMKIQHVEETGNEQEMPA